jgi:hypothetical protein
MCTNSIHFFLLNKKHSVYTLQYIYIVTVYETDRTLTHYSILPVCTMVLQLFLLLVVCAVCECIRRNFSALHEKHFVRAAYLNRNVQSCTYPAM